MVVATLPNAWTSQPQPTLLDTQNCAKLPPTMLTGTLPVTPVICTPFEPCNEFSGTLSFGAKAKAAGTLRPLARSSENLEMKASFIATGPTFVAWAPPPVTGRSVDVECPAMYTSPLVGWMTSAVA